jgi:hypothetical protein
MKELNISRKLISAYYMSILIFISIFSVARFREFIEYLTTIFSNILDALFSIRIDGSDRIWWALFVVSFGVVYAIRQLVVNPLGFYVNEESNVKWEKWVLLVLVTGCLMYNLNLLFPDYAMPEIFPDFLVKLLDGTKRTVSFNSYSDLVMTNIVAPLLWNVGPIAIMSLMHLRSKINAPAPS